MHKGHLRIHVEHARTRVSGNDIKYLTNSCFCSLILTIAHVMSYSLHVRLYLRLSIHRLGDITTLPSTVVIRRASSGVMCRSGMCSCIAYQHRSKVIPRTLANSLICSSWNVRMCLPCKIIPAVDALTCNALPIAALVSPRCFLISCNVGIASPHLLQCTPSIVCSLLISVIL